MCKLFYYCFIFLFIPFTAIAQITPKEGSALHYRIIGFSFPTTQTTGKYTIEIANGNYADEKSFKANLFKSITATTGKVIGEVPVFGRQYTWRVLYPRGQATPNKSEFHHFSTLQNDEIDSCNMRLRILQKAKKYAGSYVFLDAHKALYDMNGQPVWFMPEVDTSTRNSLAKRDIKISPFGTITFMCMTDIYEINYDGTVLWKGPKKGIVNGDTDEHFHHEFTRLNNGNYMVLGNEGVWYKTPLPSDSTLNLVPGNKMHPDPADTTWHKMFFGTVIEYDKSSNVIWSWRSSSYYASSDINYHKTPDNSINLNTHQNAFFFDEKNKAVYVSFKGVNRVVKVKYPEGTVSNVYGELFKPGVPEQQNGLFCAQHCCRISQKGYLYLYNNNMCHMRQPSTLIMMQEPTTKNETLKKVWEYECTIDRTPATKNLNYQFPAGGSVFELPDQSVFACMGGMYSKIFIISPDKKILWSALPEKWEPNVSKWVPNAQYRASIISREELERLIWNDQPGQ